MKYVINLPKFVKGLSALFLTSFSLNQEAQAGGNTLSLHLSAIADMDASDTATVSVSLNEGAQVADIVSTAEQTWFSGALLA